MAAMQRDYLLTNTQADSRSRRLGGKEWHKNTIHDIWQHSNAIVAHRKHNIVAFLNSRHYDLGIIITSTSLAAIFKQIQEELLHLRPVNIKLQIIIRHDETDGNKPPFKSLPKQLSDGQQQRVTIARVVVDQPKLIPADEPTGNLDSKNGKEVIDLLIELNRARSTIVTVTHSMHDAGYADRIINLFDGKIVNGKFDTINDQLDNTKEFM